MPFSIKHVRQDRSSKTYDAITGTFIPSPKGDRFEIEQSNGDKQVVYGGDVFVMNSEGKTIDRYRLSGDDPDIGLPPSITKRRLGSSYGDGNGK